MIDLHVHSCISDGSDTPTEVIKKAKEKGLKAVTLTDHDSIDGLDEASAMAKALGVNFIRGIEFSVSYGKGRLIHILGLGIDPNNEVFLKGYNDCRIRKEERIEYVFSELKQKGISPKPEEVYEFASGGRLDRQSIVKWLVANQYADTVSKGWIEYLDYIPYIEGELIEPSEAFRLIKAAGGLSFLAHYTKPIGLRGYSEEESIRRLRELKEMGLDGIERYYPSFTRKDEEQAERYMERIGLIPSGGSDYHGKNRPHIDLGVGDGQFSVPDKVYENILMLRS